MKTIKQNQLRRYAQVAGQVAKTVAKRVGIEGAEMLAGASGKLVVEKAIASLGKEIGIKLLEQLPKVEGVEVGEAVKSVLKKQITAGALQSSKEGSEQIAKSIVKELEGQGIKTSVKVIEQALINERGLEILGRFAVALEKGAEKEFLSKLTSQETVALRETMFKALSSDGATAETKQIFMTMLGSSPKFTASVACQQTIKDTLPALGKFLQLTTNPLGFLQQRLAKYPIMQAWLADRTILKFTVGAFTATSTFGLIKNFFGIISTNFSNLQDLVSTIISNLHNYNFQEPSWNRLVAGLDRRLNEGLKEHNEAKMANLMPSDTEIIVKDKLNNSLKKISTGDEKLSGCFKLLSSSEFRSVFDSINSAESSKVGNIADVGLGVAEHLTPVDIKDITIIQDAAKHGLSVLETSNNQIDQLLLNLDKTIQKDTQQSKQLPQEKNEMSLFTGQRILQTYIKVSQMLYNIRK